jgi:ribose transport system substrate-binding protein
MCTMSGLSGPALRRGAWSMLGLVAAVGVAGCGAHSSSASAPEPGGAVALTTPATGCGSLPTTRLENPGNGVSALPAPQRAAYVNFPQAVYPSTWAHWRPSHKPPYKVAVVWGPAQSDFESLTLNAIVARLKQSPEIRSVTSVTQESLNVPAQLQNLSAAAQSGADLIIVEPGEADAFAGPIKKLAAQGVPVITVLGGPAIASSINVDPNNYEGSAQSAAITMQLMHDKGNVVIVHGLQGIEVDNEASAAFSAVMSRCPDIKQVGSVTGEFQVALAKSQTLQFLSTHPGPVGGVLQVADMAPGVMSAFQQSGRPMPVVDDIGNQKGSLGYWRENAKTYTGVGTGLPPVGLGDSVADIALRTLEGQGPKLNTITQRVTVITSKNLDAWTQPSWNLQTVGTALGPSGPFMSDAFLDPLFNHGSTPK